MRRFRSITLQKALSPLRFKKYALTLLNAIPGDPVMIGLGRCFPSNPAANVKIAIWLSIFFFFFCPPDFPSLAFCILHFDGGAPDSPTPSRFDIYFLINCFRIWFMCGIGFGSIEDALCWIFQIIRKTGCATGNWWEKYEFWCRQYAGSWMLLAGGKPYISYGIESVQSSQTWRS